MGHESLDDVTGARDFLEYDICLVISTYSVATPSFNPRPISMTLVWSIHSEYQHPAVWLRSVSITQLWEGSELLPRTSYNCAVTAHHFRKPHPPPFPQSLPHLSSLSPSHQPSSELQCPRRTEANIDPQTRLTKRAERTRQTRLVETRI